jgi:hypothetical protein
LLLSEPVLIYGVYLDHIQDHYDKSYKDFYQSETLTVGDLESLSCFGTEFKRTSFTYDWRRAWTDTIFIDNVDTTIFEKYLFFTYRVKMLNTSATVEIDRITCWDEPNASTSPPNLNGWGKVLFEPEITTDTLLQNRIWNWVQVQLSPFEGDTNIFGFRGVGEQCRVSNNWAIEKMLTDTLANHNLKSDFLMASAPPEYPILNILEEEKPFVYSLLYYTNPEAFRQLCNLEEEKPYIYSYLYYTNPEALRKFLAENKNEK